MVRSRRNNKSPEEVYEETVEQIESARRRKITRLYLGKGRRALQRIPPLKDLPHLTELNLNGTSVSDLTPLSTLRQLKSLWLGHAPVTNFRPLASLGQLQMLSFEQNKVTDWAPLSMLENLQVLSVSNTAVLDLLPLEKLTKLRRLNLAASHIQDIGQIAHLKNLRELWLKKLAISDLSPLVLLDRLTELSIEELANPLDLSGLSRHSSLKSIQVTRQVNVDLSNIHLLQSLERLVVTRSQGVVLPRSLADLENLKTVSLYHTNISDLAPLKMCEKLETLIVRYTPVRDISPIINLTQIKDLGLDNSKIEDLSPIAGMVSLINGAKFEHQGVSFSGCPIPDVNLFRIARTRNPQRTIDTLNYLRRKLGLPLVEDVVASSEAIDWRSRALMLDQSPLGVRFEAADDYFAISASGGQSDKAAGRDRLTGQLHEQIKAKSNELVARAVRLANTAEWQSLTQASVRFNELIQADIETVAENVGLVWAELVSLGSFLEQDDSLRSAPEAFASPLDADVRRPLVDVLQTAGPWIRRFPSARELDEDHAAFQTPRNATAPALEIVTVADDEAVIDNEDAQIIEGALRSGGKDGVQSLKARSWGVLSVRNLIVGAMGVAAINVTGGAFKEVGVEVAKDSILAQKSIRLILSSEDALLQFLSNLPADIRSTVRALIDDLKSKSSEPEFPLPRPPEEKPVRNKRKK